MRLCALAGLLGFAALAAAEVPHRRRLALKPCRLEHPGAHAGADRRVRQRHGPRESRSSPTAARSSCSSRACRRSASTRQPDPLFLIAGGPGTSAVDLYTSSAGPVRSRAPRSRHHPARPARHRPLASPRLRLRRPEPVRDASTRSKSGPPTSSAATSSRRPPTCAVHHQHRGARSRSRCGELLGYERINLYGSSYGTRVAQHYARRYPEVHAHADPRRRGRIREVVLGPAIAIDAERALERILDALHARRGLREGVHRSVRGLPRAARAARGEARRDAWSARRRRAGRSTSISRARHLSAVLRFASYNDDQAALLPLSLHLADAREQLHAAREPVPRVRALARGGFRLRHAQQRGLQRGHAAHRRREARSHRARRHAHGRRCRWSS